MRGQHVQGLGALWQSQIASGCISIRMHNRSTEFLIKLCRERYDCYYLLIRYSSLTPGRSSNFKPTACSFAQPKRSRIDGSLGSNNDCVWFCWSERKWSGDLLWVQNEMKYYGRFALLGHNTLAVACGKFADHGTWQSSSSEAVQLFEKPSYTNRQSAYGDTHAQTVTRVP